MGEAHGRMLAVVGTLSHSGQEHSSLDFILNAIERP